MLPGLLDEPGIEKVSFRGLSMGGMAGRWLGINAPERLARLALADTTSYSPNRKMWRERTRMAEIDDISAIAEASIGRWFTPGRAAGDDSADVIANARGFIMQTILERRPGGGVAIGDMDFRAEPR
jgi:3-oxoadipate enol-lactonase